MTTKTNIIELPKQTNEVPDGLIKVLERIIADAKAGKLTELVLGFHSETDEPGEHAGGAQVFWSSDGRDDAVFASASILQKSAFDTMTGVDEG